jgi:hypothetical protein
VLDDEGDLVPPHLGDVVEQGLGRQDKPQPNKSSLDLVAKFVDVL